MYVRMSSRPQDHSIEHQCAKLAQYAEEHDLEVVKVYADPGKSGLRINGRDGLQELIADVQSSEVDFQVILVYDVSRWGRFQDVDEGAHYEYVCRRAGIEVVYCAEPFPNDGSAIASILKGMKRTMAAEYSRELSDKVFTAQCRFVSKGYKMGGSVGYGLRRVSYDQDGQRRRELKLGERKAALTDRVRFALGPQHEVDMVRSIYHWYVHEKLGDAAIAARLNAMRVPSESRRPWTAWLVKGILTNEKYIGRLVFNRGSAKMSQPRTLNAADDWICIDQALPPIVSVELFEAATTERQRRLQGKTNDQLLQMLRALYEHHGKVTVELINAAKGIPNPKYFAARFGTLAAAYKAAGLPADKALLRARTLRAVRQIRVATISAIELMIERAGGRHAPHNHPWLKLINGRIVLKVVVARSRHEPSGHIRWRIPIHTAPVPDFVLCVQLDAANAGVMCSSSDLI